MIEIIGASLGAMSYLTYYGTFISEKPTEDHA